MRNILSNPKFRNPYFWVSILGVIFASAGIDVNTLTSWSLFMNAIVGIFGNPVSIIAVSIALVGIFNDNGTKGLDSITKYDDSRGN